MADQGDVYPDGILVQLKRIADAQENLLAIAIEARGERVKMAAKMADALKRPLQEKSGA